MQRGKCVSENDIVSKSIQHQNLFIVHAVPLMRLDFVIICFYLSHNMQINVAEDDIPVARHMIKFLP